MWGKIPADLGGCHCGKNRPPPTAGPDPILSSQRLRIREDRILSTQRLSMRAEQILSIERPLSLEDRILSTQRCAARADMNVFGLE